MTEQSSLDTIDILEIRLQAELVARAEYEEAYTTLNSRKSQLDTRTAYWSVIAQRVKAMLVIDDSFYEASLSDEEKYLNEVARLAKVGMDFEILQRASESNPIVQAQWKKLMVSLRMVGLDENPSG